MSIKLAHFELNAINSLNKCVNGKLYVYTMFVEFSGRSSRMNAHNRLTENGGEKVCAPLVIAVINIFAMAKRLLLAGYWVLICFWLTLFGMGKGGGGFERELCTTAQHQHFFWCCLFRLKGTRRTVAQSHLRWIQISKHRSDNFHKVCRAKKKTGDARYLLQMGVIVCVRRTWRAKMKNCEQIS